MTGLELALNDLRIDLLPHQISAVNQALCSLRDHNGVILGDEVGLGKTIEGGIILSRLWQEGKRNLLIITPAGLMEQWYRELETKFHLPVEIIDSRLLRRKNAPNPFVSKKIVLCSYHFASNKAKYLSGLPWNLCCIDEAHNLRNPQGRISSTLRNVLKGVPKLLLTATSIQNKMDDLYSLANLIDEYFPKEEEERARSWKTLLVRNLRKDSDLPFVKRIAVTQNFQLSESERLLYERVDDFLSRDNLHCMRTGNRQLVKMTLRRLLASCPSNLGITLSRLEERLKETYRIHTEDLRPNVTMGKEQLLEIEHLRLKKARIQQKFSPEEIRELHRETEDLHQLQILAKETKSVSKSDALVFALREGLKRLQKTGGKRKAVIFTEFLQTQAHIAHVLESLHDFKGKTVLLNGDNRNLKAEKIYRSWKEKYRNSPRYKNHPSLDRKTALLDHFEKKADILIATDAAAEGLNLQFCSLVINYDLPWNPQRIEQRIGRCHRYGQKNDVIVVNILNLDNHAEKRLLELVTQKLNLFEETLGCSNDILGEKWEVRGFEKWVTKVFMTCRTREEIDRAFKAKEKTLERKSVSLPDDSWKPTEHLFQGSAEEARAEAEKNLGILWEICKHVFTSSGDHFNASERTFRLTGETVHKTAQGQSITLPKGKYSLQPEIHRKGYRRLSFQSPIIHVALEKMRLEKTEDENISLWLSLKDKTHEFFHPSMSGWIQVSLLRCRSRYEYEELVYSGCANDAGELKRISPEDVLFLLEQTRVIFRGIYPEHRNELDRILEEKVESEKVRLNTEFEVRMKELEAHLENWGSDKLNLLRTQLLSAQKTSRENKTGSDLVFERLWQKYTNETEEVRQQKQKVLLQARMEDAVSCEPENILVLPWRS